MSEIKDIVAFVDVSAESTGAIELGARLARDHDAHLTGVFLWPFLVRSMVADSYLRGAAIEDLIERCDREIALVEKGRR